METINDITRLVGLLKNTDDNFYIDKNGEACRISRVQILNLKVFDVLMLLEEKKLYFKPNHKP